MPVGGVQGVRGQVVVLLLAHQARPPPRRQAHLHLHRRRVQDEVQLTGMWSVTFFKEADRMWGLQF